MHWFDPKGLATRLLTIWLLLVALYIAVLVLVLLALRYWYFVLGFIAFCVGVSVLVRWLRRRFDRW